MITWILHGSQAFIGKASKGEVVVLYFESLATQHMEASGLPDLSGVDRKAKPEG